MRAIWGILLPALLWVSDSLAEKQPEIKRNEFKLPPLDLFYFDDTETVLYLEKDPRDPRTPGKVWRSTDAGKEWSQVKDISEDGDPFALHYNPFDNKVAVILGLETTHWVTYDQGENWRAVKFDKPISMGLPARVNFHAGDKDKIIIHVGPDDCINSRVCLNEAFYTTDGFKTFKKLENENKVRVCRWAKGTDLFTTGEEQLDKDRIVCIVRGRYSESASKWRLLITDDYSKTWAEPTMSNGRVLPGFQDMVVIQRFIVAVVRNEGSKELSLYATHDTKEWHRGEFGDHKIEEEQFTILESTSYSIQVDVSPSRYIEIGTLFSSNSNGTYFTKSVEHTNRFEGIVDFEKMSMTQGVIMVNVVDNWNSDMIFFEKKIKSKISFDDGRTFENLKCGKDDLHLHSYTQQRNIGPIFTSPAPGLLMGVGNTGDFLDAYTRGDLYVSDDGGLNWYKGLDEAHKYEFGDQGSILVAINDEEPTDIISYSLHHGQPDTWKTVKLENMMRAQFLTTTPDSTSLKFILTGIEGGGRGAKPIQYTLDFNGLHEKKCGEDDFETWHARTDGDKNPICVMGQKQSFRRRKAKADCFVDETFKDPEPKFDSCECTKADYECDYNFHPEGEGENKKCVPSAALPVPKDECKDGKGSYKGSSGWRLIPGNKCESGVDLTEPVDRNCAEASNPPASGDITSEVTHFSDRPWALESPVQEWIYLERPDRARGDDETVVMLTVERVAYISHDHGKKWEKLFKGDQIDYIYRHEFDKNLVYFVANKGKVYYSKNRGKDIHEFDAPAAAPNPKERINVLGFNSKNTDWLIYTGEKHGEIAAYYSTNDGGNWKMLLPSVSRCQFMASEVNGKVDEKMVYCLQHAKEDPNADLQLVTSKDWFEHKEFPFQDVVSFARMEEFILIASRAEDKKGLMLRASTDGQTYAEAKFPPKFVVDHQTGYTVLPSKTNSIFLHVTVSDVVNHEYGSIIKSNSNGVSYVMSLNNVNRDEWGQVDFEKMEVLEGIAIANVVANKEGVDNSENKRLQSRITHNDGADWDYIAPPSKDLNGKDFKCGTSAPEKCSLHLHGYTERFDKRTAYSSATAVGMMIGVGNVGEYLENAKDGDTFLTRDGGFTWEHVKEGRYMWEYGDQGSIIVLVEKNVLTKVVFYSIDEGDTWQEYKFSDTALEFAEISTLPSDTSMNFLLWGIDPKKGSIATVNIDFSGLFEKECKLNDDDPEADDYELWIPRHPHQEGGCLFGHVAKYHRKKKGRNCYNGSKVNQVHGEMESCPCTRSDFECDYNYEREAGGTCKLVEGATPPDPKAVCENKDVHEYWNPTPYRKIPISTCEGGKEMDHTSGVRPCPGWEDEFKEKHGIGGFTLFLAIVFPFAAAGGIGYYVWRNWGNTFGRIRLGETSYSPLDSDSPWISWPVAAVSGLVAVLAAVPLLMASLWRSAAGRFGGRGYGYGGRTYTSRSSFARGRGDYAVVDPDEGELLGEDSDEEA